MQIIIAFCFIAVPLLATKEYTDSDLSEFLDNPTLLREIVNRLTEDDAELFPSPKKKSFPENSRVPQAQTDSQQCKSKIFGHQIIRTDDSIKAGADYLKSFKHVASNEACRARCCSTKGCDLAVFENKTEHSCYLFRCQNEQGENLCQFDPHEGYICTTITHVKEASFPEPSGPNSELKSRPEDLSTNIDSGEMKQPPHPHPKTTPRPTQLPHSVAIGKSCISDVSCEDPHAICFDGECQCRQRFYQKKWVCREICGEKRFECKILGTSQRGPDCIPQENVCNGLTECADGSDERDCRSEYQGGDRYQPTYNRPPVKDEDHLANIPPSEPTNDLSGTDSSSKPDENKEPSSKQDLVPEIPDASEGKPDPVLPNANTKPAEPSTEQSLENTETPSDSLKQKVAEPKENEIPQTEKPTEDKSQKTENTETESPEKPAEEAKGNVDKITDVIVVEQKEGGPFMTKKKVFVTTDGAQGPIVALSLGLAFTVMLLIFVGCRLRNVRRRLRKGRPLHSNEADYLINGMYL